MSTPKIFCFVKSSCTGWFNVVGLAEDGVCLSGHASSTEDWAKHDIGMESDWKHDLYKAHYPGGYELVWLDKPDDNADCLEALKKNQEMHDQQEALT
jgi:hypothetical protein